MRIIIVGTAYPMRGGIAHYVALLSRHMKARGHEVQILSFSRQYPSLLFPGKTQMDEGRDLIPVRASALLDSINPVSWLRAFQWIRRQNPDLLVFKYWMPFFAPCYATLAFLAGRRGIGTLSVCDNIVPHEKKPGDRLLTRLGLRFMDAFIVQSRSVLDDLLSFRPGAKYTLVPHPVYEIFPSALDRDDARKQLGIGNERVLLYFGFIRAYKGLRYAVEALPFILKKMRVRLVICGEFYEGRREIMDLIESLGVRNAVTLATEFIPNEKVALYFSAADLVVLPYVSATQSGIVQIAYHYDKPVIVTRVGGLPEAVPDGETGYVVPPRDSRALADAVIRFYERGESSFIRAVRRIKRNFSWERLIEAIEELAEHEIHQI
ncbi:MAG TPA: glycosyltransferase [bacterium]|nr:glycosyltransferase [bacterium]